jgi:hypothetical protein
LLIMLLKFHGYIALSLEMFLTIMAIFRTTICLFISFLSQSIIYFFLAQNIMFLNFNYSLLLRNLPQCLTLILTVTLTTLA